jgi:FKBP-type peptidyl-prolyl cis-trans isomerase
MKTLVRILVALALVSLGGCRNKHDGNDGSALASAASKPAQAPKPAASATAPAVQEKPSIPAPKDVAAPPANAQKSESGLAWVVLKPGTGTDKPNPDDKVTVHYTGWSADGTMFDSSEVRGRPTTFSLSRVIAGWTEGVGLMTKGERRRFWIPGKLAYGDKPVRPGMPSGQLTFDVELLDIAAAPVAPKDVAAPPAGAKKTASGLAYMELTPGKPGGKKPTAESKVTVHYSGWTKDGKMFDSSVTRGSPATFGLNGVIKGWTEGLQLMPEGAKFRFWIPGVLAYGEKPARPGMPAGQLTFDVELISIQ